MNKKDLVTHISKNMRISKTEANKVVDSFLGSINSALQKSDKVTLTGFGTFTVRKSRRQTRRSLSSGETSKSVVQKVIIFTAEKGLKDAAE